MNELIVYILKALMPKTIQKERGKVSAHEKIQSLGSVSSYSQIPTAPRIPTPTSPRAPITPTVPTSGRTIARPVTPGKTLSGPGLTGNISNVRKKLPF